MELKDLTFQQLRGECKKRGIAFDNKDTKAILLDKLTDKSISEVDRVSKLDTVRDRMSVMEEVIVTKLNPEDTRTEVLITIMNATGDYSYPVIFGQKMKIPKPIIKHIENMEYQAWKRVTHPTLGQQDVPYMTKAYSVSKV